jgi:hypothetical protein
MEMLMLSNQHLILAPAVMADGMPRTVYLLD